MNPRTIVQFEILEQIGEGGMGVVYRARDTKLNRDVALKVLPADKVADSARRSRFVQEAQAASALNHPNIITIYDILQDNGVDAIVMEFVKGRTLESLASRKGLPLADILKYSLQIADALTAAHAAGIVHRDLKPSNVMATDGGLVKVLDFGLAKLTERVADEHQATESMRLPENSPKTEEGTLLGTVAYMSPEQAEGKKVDGRSDIFSFGAMLYEMVTGRRAFQGDSRLSILSAILREEPKPPSQLGEPVPRDLEKIIARCLRKDPTRRFQHADDLKVALQELKEESESGALMAGTPVAIARPGRRWAVPLTVGLALIVAAVGGTAWWMSRSRKPAAAPQLRRLTFDSSMTISPALSPDGKLLAYASDRAGEGKLDIWLQQVSGGDAVRLTRLPQDEEEPAFSPDGSKVAFWYRAPGQGGGIYVVSTLGGEPRKLADRGRNPQFSPDGNWIAYSGLEGVRPAVFVIAATGGSPRRLVPDFVRAQVPLWSPDGKHILFHGSRGDKGPLLDRLDWWVTPAEGGAPVRTGAGEAVRRQDAQSGLRLPGVWAGNRILFSVGSPDTQNLWEITLNPRTFLVEGPARQLTFGAGRETSPALAAGGVLAYAAAVTNTDFWGLPVDGNTGKPAGEIRQITRNSASDSWALITADGKSIMFCSTKGGNSDVWRKNLDTGTETAVVATAAQEHLWGMSSDGSKVLYLANENRKTALYIGGAAGGAQKVCEECVGVLSSDGARVFYAEGNLLEVHDLFLFDVATGQRTQVLQAGKDICFPCLLGARFSPDDRWGAFYRASAAGVNRGIILVPFRDGKLVETEAIIVTDKPGEDDPFWSPDGNLLYLLSTRDGYTCVWAHRLDPSTKQPQGEPFAVHHFHSSNRYMRPRHLSVARDRLVVGVAGGSSNIWMTRLPE